MADTSQKEIRGQQPCSQGDAPCRCRQEARGGEPRGRGALTAAPAGMQETDPPQS